MQLSLTSRFLAALFALVLVLCACSKKQDASPSSSVPDESSEPEDTSIRLIQLEDPADDALIATVKTSMGEFKIVLYPDYAPYAVENFYQHAVDGYYNGRIFFRVIDNFMIQTGDPRDDGTGGESIWKEPFDDEFTDDLWHFRGAVAMANSGNSNGSQFFIVQNYEVPEQTMEEMQEYDDLFPEEVVAEYAENGGVPWLDHVHTVFGQVISGMETVDKIARVPTDDEDCPKDKIIIQSIDFNQRYRSRIPVSSGAEANP